jgi:hypothetical protein
MIATKGTVELAMTGVFQDAEDVTVVNADNELIASEQQPPVLLGYDVTAKMTGIEPDYLSWVTGQDVIYNDAAVPLPVGLASGANDAAIGNCAFEGWMRLAGESCSGTYPWYAYLLLPWLINGKFTDITFNKGLAECSFTARARNNSPWGVGPYPVVRSAAVATLNFPEELQTAVASDQYRILLRTTLPYPLVTTTCAPVTDTTALAVVDDDGAGPLLNATATLPVGAGLTPGTIDWGDATPITYEAGPLATHVYALAGTYTVTYRPWGQSGPLYTDVVVMA